MKKKWTLRQAGILFWALVLIVSAAYLVYTSVKPVQKAEKKVPTIALVNEDAASEFNGQQYNFGKDFVNLVSNDESYNWQVVSRSVADNAFEDGTIDAVIYLPQSFSKDILTFQNLNPSKANIEYKVQPQSDQLSTTLLQDEIVTTLYSFNQSVVKMYYASVANSLAEAEGHMNASLGNQETFVTNLTNQIQTPVQNLMPQYGTLITNTTTLNTLNQSNVTLQNSFVDSTTNILKQTGTNMTGQLTAIQSQIDLQNKIAQLNADNANKAIAQQAESDQTFYRGKFDDLNTGILTQLTNFYQEQEEAKSEAGVLAALKQKIAQYNQTVTQSKEFIDGQVKSLKSRREELLALETNLYAQFFSLSDTMTPDNYQQFADRQTSENARKALAAKVQESLGTTDVVSTAGYMTQLNNLIGAVSVVPSDYQLDALVANGSLDESKKADYEAQLDLISRYAAAFGVSTTRVSLPTAPSAQTVHQTATKDIRVLVPAGETYTLATLPAAVTSPSAPIVFDNSAGSDAREFSTTLTVDMGTNTSVTIDLEWKNKSNATALRTTETMTLSPQDGALDYYKFAGKDNFQQYTNLFQNIEKAAQMITLLYGAPGASYRDLGSKVTADDFKAASPNSVYALYGNVSYDTLENRLSANDVENYRKMGQENIQKLVTTLEKLNQSIADLEAKSKELDGEISKEFFAENVADLEKWYRTTSADINKLYGAWTSNSANVLKVSDWSNNSAQDTGLYTISGQELFNQINTIVTNTSQTSNTIAENAKTVENHSQQFENLVSSASTIQSEVQTVLNSTNSLAEASQTSVTENQNYTKQFSQILANTRTQGTDKNSLYQFFANPLDIEDKSENYVETLPKQTDYSWVLIFIVGLSSGALLAMIAGRIIMRRAA